MSTDTTANPREIELEMCLYEGKTKFVLTVFGDELAKRYGYKEHKGLDAVKFYLIEKYHWTPACVASMSVSDLDFLIAEEKHGWKLPEDARLPGLRSKKL